MNKGRLPICRRQTKRCERRLSAGLVQRRHFSGDTMPNLHCRLANAASPRVEIVARIGTITGYFRIKEWETEDASFVTFDPQPHRVFSMSTCPVTNTSYTSYTSQCESFLTSLILLEAFILRKLGNFSSTRTIHLSIVSNVLFEFHAQLERVDLLMRSRF